MARDEAKTVRREDLHGRGDLHGREDLRDDLHDEGGIPPEKISGRTHPERPAAQEGISPEVISGG